MPSYLIIIKRGLSPLLVKKKKTLKLQEKYFRDECSIEKISMILKLRVWGEHLTLNYIPHREDLLLFCSTCNLEEREDVFNCLGRCPFQRLETPTATAGKLATIALSFDVFFFISYFF